MSTSSAIACASPDDASAVSSPPASSAEVDAFIARWRGASGENANRQMYLQQLCDLLRVPHPNPRRENNAENAYCFERTVTFTHGDGTISTGNIDLYKRDCFLLEAKETGLNVPSSSSSSSSSQSPVPSTPPAPRRRSRHSRPPVRGWDLAMEKARRQAEDYVRALPRTESQPPFLVVADIGRCFEVYADFSRSGKTYTPFPDFPGHRIHLTDLHDPKIQDRLRRVWTDPLSLDPTRTSARVTREIAANLAELARDLEISESARTHPGNAILQPSAPPQPAPAPDSSPDRQSLSTPEPSSQAGARRSQQPPSDPSTPPILNSPPQRGARRHLSHALHFHDVRRGRRADQTRFVHPPAGLAAGRERPPFPSRAEGALDRHELGWICLAHPRTRHAVQRRSVCRLRSAAAHRRPDRSAD